MQIVESNRSNTSLTLAEEAFMAMALKFGHFSDDRDGLKQARKAMRLQERKIRPSLFEVVSTYINPQASLSAGREALGLSDWATVMRTSHRFTTASVSVGEGFVSPDVVSASLKFHAAVAGCLLDQFGETDYFLRSTGLRAFGEAHGDSINDYTLLASNKFRAILNVVAHNGTLGPDARALFSPRSVARF